jgi:hypothetical protein
MKKKERIYLIVFITLFVAYVATDFMAPEPVNWRVTFHSQDKNPFGGFILNERSSDLFKDGFELSYQTISELENESNIVILAENAEIVGTDFDKLLETLKQGGSVWIGANSFSVRLQDSLGFDVNFSSQLKNQNIFEAPKSSLRLSDSSEYSYPSTLITNFFELDHEDHWEILSKVDGNPVAIKRSWNGGTLVLNSIPYIFTNFGLLVSNNYPAAAKLLSTLPEDDVHYTMYYQSGKGEATTPLRYFLKQDALRWSIYLALFSIIIFLFISSWRQQRAIPVVSPLENATIHYVKTLGALFYREKDHKKAAMKVINHFVGSLRERYFVSVDYTERFYKLLAAKSGVSTEEVIKTFELILRVKDLPVIEEKVLIELTRKIELFR